MHTYFNRIIINLRVRMGYKRSWGEDGEGTKGCNYILIPKNSKINV